MRGRNDFNIKYFVGRFFEDLAYIGRTGDDTFWFTRRNEYEAQRSIVKVLDGIYGRISTSLATQPILNALDFYAVLCPAQLA
jgi:hypothetical protein